MTPRRRDQRQAGRPDKGDEVRRKVREYLRGALAHPAERRPLDVRSVAAYVPCSPTLIYKYELDALVRRVGRRLTRAGALTPRGAARARLEVRLAAARQEAEAWQHKYRQVLARLAVIEDRLAAHHAIDLDALYANGPRPADRSRPR